MNRARRFSTGARLRFGHMPLFGRPSVQDQQREAFWRAWIQRQHPLALASVVLSVFSMTHFGTLWLDELAGIALGAIVLVRLRRPDESREGRLLAWLGIIIGVISLLCACIIYFVLPNVNRA